VKLVHTLQPCWIGTKSGISFGSFSSISPVVSIQILKIWLTRNNTMFISDDDNMAATQQVIVEDGTLLKKKIPVFSSVTMNCFEMRQG
jgi:hypothetical protein